MNGMTVDEAMAHCAHSWTDDAAAILTLQAEVLRLREAEAKLARVEALLAEQEANGLVEIDDVRDAIRGVE